MAAPFAETTDVAAYAERPTPAVTSGKITKVEKVNGTWLIWFNGEEAYCCTHGANGQPNAYAGNAVTARFTKTVTLPPGAAGFKGWYENGADTYGNVEWASLLYRMDSRSITTGRRTFRRNTGYLPILKRPSLSTPFSLHSNGFKKPHPLRKRTRRGLLMKNGKTSGQHGPKHKGGAYHQLLPYQ